MKTVNFLLVKSRVEEKNVNRGNADSILVKFMAFDDGIVTNDNGLNCFAVWLFFLCNCFLSSPDDLRAHFQCFYNSKLQHNKLKHKIL